MESSIEKFLFHCKYEKNLTSKTIKAYQIDLTQFKEFMLLKYNIREIKRIGKEQLKNYLQFISHFKPKTIKRKIASAKALFNFLEFEELVESSPFRKVRFKIKEPMVLPTVMTIDEVSKIFKTIYGTSKKNERKDRIRDIAVIELLFGTGIRVSELCSLSKEIVNTDFTLIKVNGKGRKERTIQISNEEIKRALKRYYLAFVNSIEKSDFFFVNRLGNRLSEQSVRLMIRKYRLQSNISKNITPHVFRHSFATLLLEKDVDIKYIQTMLGHSSIMTTQIYTHVNSEKQSEILHLKHPRNELSYSAVIRK